jgi:3-methyladenine DNA glycosylase AlkD
VRTADEVVAQLRSLADPDNVAGMMRYGISGVGALGVSMPTLRGIAKEFRACRRSDPAAVHALAAELWASGVHEARTLAGLIDVPGLVTVEQADAWVADMDSWDTVDGLSGLWAQTSWAHEQPDVWVRRDEEFVRRSGFVLMCALTVHDKKAPNELFLHYLTLIERGADDERNFVKKAVNWALRQIGKRNAVLHAAAVEVARRLRESGSKAARWIAADALRELEGPAVRARLRLDPR